MATTSVTIVRPDEVSDPYETADTVEVAVGVPAHISSPSGGDRRVGGDSMVIDAVLFVPTDTPLTRADTITDDTTGDEWRVTWVQRRVGLGLDHQKAGLVTTQGASNG